MEPDHPAVSLHGRKNLLMVNGVSVLLLRADSNDCLPIATARERALSRVVIDCDSRGVRLTKNNVGATLTTVEELEQAGRDEAARLNALRDELTD